MEPRAGMELRAGMAEIHDERLRRLRARMAETETDLVAVGPSSHMVWLAGLSPHGDERPVMLLISATHAGLLIPALNVDSARMHTELPFYPWADGAGAHAALETLLDDLDARRPGLAVALDETMRADFALLLLDALPGARRSFLDETVSYLRASKDEHEFATLKANALLNDRAMQAGVAALTPGVSEQEVADVIRAYFLAHGARPAFTLICFGENGAFPHHHTGERRLRENEPVLLDIGCFRDGYASDMTRVAVCGAAPEGYDELHAVLERAVTAAVAAAKPGVPASEVDKAARDVIAAAGYGDYFVHRTGHGLGIDVHEPPYITATSSLPLREGQVFSIEPGVYLPGRFGIRLEEVVIVRGNRAEVLSELPRDAQRLPLAA